MENRAEDKFCRACGAKLDEHTGDYVETLIGFSLNHPVPSISAMAAETLGKIGDVRAVEPLIKILNSSQEPELLEAATEALGNLRDGRAVSSLLKFMQRGTVSARLKAVNAIEKIGGSKAAAALKEIAANDPSSNVRNEAKCALSRMSD
jgi:HEAT repeat protein